jgi:hypothetical protein
MSGKWFADGLRFECTQCGNCCRNHGDYTHVYLAPHDVQAIAAYLRLSREEFLARHCTLDEGWVTLRTDAPACPVQRCLRCEGDGAVSARRAHHGADRVRDDRGSGELQCGSALKSGR